VEGPGGGGGGGAESIQQRCDLWDRLLDSGYVDVSTVLTHERDMK
jgi:hypothetical protein